MKMKNPSYNYRLSTLLIFFICSLFFSQKKDTLISKDIEEVKIIKSNSILIKQKKDRYHVDVIGTNFQDQTDAWEALKTIPILKVEENSGISLFNKKVRLEINGVLIQISASEIEDYIKNINPKDIKSVEIISNPNASYPSDIEAVINIILYSRIDNYRIGINYNNGFRRNFFSTPGISANLNYKKIRGYINYSYNFIQPVYISDIEYDIVNKKRNILAEDNRQSSTHSVMSNLNWDITEKTRFTLIQDITVFNNQSIIDERKTNEKIDMETDRKVFKFSQIFHHNFNDKNKLKLGAQQVIPTTNFHNFTFAQHVRTETPIYNYFIDYTNINSLGETLLGFKLSSITSKNSNNNDSILNVFNYNETTHSSYLNQSISLGKNRSISAGVRYESTIAEAHNESLKILHRTFDNLLFNISYNTLNQEKQQGRTFSLKKTIQRPNYNYLNRYAINNNIIGFVGDEDIRPSKYYSVGYEQFYKNFFYTTQLMYIKDYLSTFYTTKNNLLLNTYKNFSNTFAITLGGGYSKDIFKFWNLNFSTDFVYFKLEDEEYNRIINNSTPRISLNINNKFSISKSTIFNINYSFMSNYNDGLIKHYSTNKLNLILTKRFKNIDAIIYFYDIFKGMTEREEINNSLFYINSSSYKDSRVIGISLRWNMLSKNFKSQKTEEIKDESIDRL